MLLIYTDSNSPRVLYSVSLFFTTLQKTAYKFTQSKEEFLVYAGAKCSYSAEPIADELHFTASGFLNEQTICPQQLNLVDYNGYTVPFKVEASVLPFDVFAAAFYLVSRYEEYLPFEADTHGRFAAENSFAYQYQFLAVPVINVWAMEVKKMLLAQFPALGFEENRYSFHPTFDIDQAFLIKGKSIKLKLRVLIAAALKGQLADFVTKVSVLLGRKKDPFDVYDAIYNIHQQQDLTVFFLMGDYGGNDISLSYKSQPFKKIIQAVGNRAKVGIHPSLLSNKNNRLVAEEKNKLSNIVGKEITHSRQHYLCMSFPATYRQLLAVGITSEYSMGYASQVGFRASIANPFYWYDLQAEKTTDLVVHPFAVMDQTLRQYLKCSPMQGLQICKNLINEVKMVQGDFCTLWHNESMSNRNQWEGWRRMYEELVNIARE